MRFKQNNQMFTYRVAGVAIYNNKVLLHRAEIDDFWALPGGSCEFGEESQNALKREISEEINANIEVGPLIWVVENFFEMHEAKWHEVGFYYRFDFTENSKRLYEQQSFMGLESYYDNRKDYKLYFEWVALEDLNSRTIKPQFLTDKLLNISNNIEVVINRDKSK